QNICTEYTPFFIVPHYSFSKHKNENTVYRPIQSCTITCIVSSFCYQWTTFMLFSSFFLRYFPSALCHVVKFPLKNDLCGNVHFLRFPREYLLQRYLPHRRHLQALS